MSKPKKRKLVCPKTYRGKKVRAAKGACFVTLASGKKKRVKKVAPAKRARPAKLDYLAHKTSWREYDTADAPRTMRGHR